MGIFWACPGEGQRKGVFIIFSKNTILATGKYTKKAFITIGFILYFFFAQIISAIITLVYRMFNDPDFYNRLADALSTQSINSKEYMECVMELVPSAMLISTSLVIIPLIIYWIKKKESPYKNPFKNGITYGIKYILSIVALAVFLNLFTEFIIGLLPTSFVTKYTSSTNAVADITLWKAVLTTGILVPIAEELTFRYMIFKTFKEKWVVALIVSSILFAISHWNPIQSTYALLFGLIMGYLYHITRNLLTNTLLHITVNTSSLLFVRMPNAAVIGIFVISGILVVCLTYKFFKEELTVEKLDCKTKEVCELSNDLL